MQAVSAFFSNRSQDMPLQAWRIAAGVLAFSIPLWYAFQSVALGLVVAAWIWVGLRRQTVFRGAMLLWIALFLLFTVSAILSVDQENAWNIWGRLLALLLMPLALGCGPRLQAPDYRRIQAGFVLGNVVCAVYCFVYTAFAAAALSPAAFFNDALTKGLDYNAAYASFHALAGLCFCLFGPALRHSTRLPGKRYGGAAVILFGFMLFLGARLPLALAACTIGVFFLRMILFKSLRRIGLLLLLLSFVGVFLLFFWMAGSLLTDRYANVIPAASHVTIGRDARDANNLDKRKILWQAAWEMYEEHGRPWSGVGIGDFQEALQKRLAAPEFRVADFHHLAELGTMNAHNQYLQSLVAAGPLLLLIFLEALLLVLYRCLTRGSLASVFIWASCLLFMLQESALFTQAGLFPIVFFGVLFMMPQRSGYAKRPSNRLS